VLIKMRSILKLLSLVTIIILIVGCDHEEPIQLTISAASSLAEALQEIQSLYNKKNAAVKINLNFGATGELQQQIEQGAPVDIFFSSATKPMRKLIDQQWIDEDQQLILLSNELVIITSTARDLKIEKIQELTQNQIERIAIGIPESVPAGNYAKEALMNVKLWNTLQPKLIQAKDVKQVLQYVETGNVDAGFVYKTDALVSSKVNMALILKPDLHSAITYHLGVVKSTRHLDETLDFFTFLQSAEALDIFKKYGFTVPK
jgi:molybdate transport system substrate-binding protein